MHILKHGWVSGSTSLLGGPRAQIAEERKSIIHYTGITGITLICIKRGHFCNIFFSQVDCSTKPHRDKRCLTEIVDCTNATFSKSLSLNISLIYFKTKYPTIFRHSKTCKRQYTFISLSFKSLRSANPLCVCSNLFILEIVRTLRFCATHEGMQELLCVAPQTVWQEVICGYIREAQICFKAFIFCACFERYIKL